MYTRFLFYQFLFTLSLSDILLSFECLHWNVILVVIWIIVVHYVLDLCQYDSSCCSFSLHEILLLLRLAFFYYFRFASIWICNCCNIVLEGTAVGLVCPNNHLVSSLVHLVFDNLNREIVRRLSQSSISLSFYFHPWSLLRLSHWC